MHLKADDGMDRRGDKTEFPMANFFAFVMKVYLKSPFSSKIFPSFFYL